MSDRLRPAERLEACAASAVLVLAVVGLALLLLTTPLYVRAMVSLVDAESLTGLSRRGTFDAAESVRRFVVDPGAPALSAVIEGRPAFDANAVSHLVDVREVIVPSRSLGLAALVLAVAWLALRRRRRPQLLAAACSGAAWFLAVAFPLAVVFAIADFDAFFTWFHTLFFAAGTWVFPNDALLIRVFPLPFWMASGAVGAVIVLVGTGLLFTFAHRMRFTATHDGV